MSDFELYAADESATDAEQRKVAVEAALRLIEVDLANKHSAGYTSLDAHLDKLPSYADKILDALR